MSTYGLGMATLGWVWHPRLGHNAGLWKGDAAFGRFHSEGMGV